MLARKGSSVGEPFYATLADRLRRDILSGKIPPGGKLPSERVLKEDHGFARGTVRRALEELIAEGLVESHNGKGYTVRVVDRLIWTASAPENNVDTTQNPSGAWADSVRKQGRMPSMVIETQITYANERIAGWLNISTGDAVTVRKRLRLVDGEPFSTADSWYPRSIVGGTDVELPGDVQPGVYAVFAKLGHPWVRTVDRWTPRPPTREESTTLKIPRGVAVAEIVRRSFDTNAVPVRLSIFVLPGDRHEIEYLHSEVNLQ